MTIEQLHPTFYDFLTTQKIGTHLIHMQNDMVVITHDCLSGNINSINVGKKTKAGDNPLFAVVIVITSDWIFATQESTAYAASNGMVK